VFESQARFNVEEKTRFEPGMPITTKQLNLEPNIRILDTIVCTAQTHCKHKHAFSVSKQMGYIVITGLQRAKNEWTC
jgi:hypothetical protein